MYFVSNDENKAVQSIIEMAQIIEAIHREKLRPNIADDFEMQGDNAAAALLTFFSWMFVQYIPRNMHTVLLCFALLWLCNRS